MLFDGEESKQKVIKMTNVCEFPNISGHVAVRFKNFIIAFGGRQQQSLCNMIWLYNLYTEQWSEQVLPNEQLSPPKTEYSCAVTIGETIYMFGGYDLENRSYTNALWKLTINPTEPFVWSKINAQSKEKTPSPRQHHSGWEYGGKLWTFGGKGSLPDGYLHCQEEFYAFFDTSTNNQLLCFDPSEQAWTNVRSSGTKPEDRYWHTTAITGSNMVWLHGGFSNRYGRLDDLYQLNMPTLEWTKIQSDTKPLGRFACSLTAATDNQLLLYGGCTNSLYTWIFNTSSLKWSQHPTGWNSAYHMGHTGTKGTKSSVFILGGKKHTRKQLSRIVSLIPEPKDLQHMAMKVIFQNRDSLPLNILPKVLITQIMFPEKREDHHK